MKNIDIIFVSNPVYIPLYYPSRATIADSKNEHYFIPPLIAFYGTWSWTGY